MNRSLPRLALGFRAARAAALMAAAAAFGPVPAAGQVTYEILHTFLDPGGEISQELTLADDGTFYGTMSVGGEHRYGSIFALHPNGSDLTFEEVYSFTGADGAYPIRGVTFGPDGALYGSTSRGGDHDRGTFFRLDQRRRLTRIHSIDFDEPNNASGLTLGPDGFFYGTTQFGGVPGAGTLFRLSPSGEYTTLYVFPGMTEGRFPTGRLTLGADGRFYGTTLFGGTGSGGPGTVFSATTSGVVATLHRFTTVDGANPINGVAFGIDGKLYGSTAAGGAHASGTAYRLTTDGQFELIHDFPLPKPMSNLVLAGDGNVYGTTLGPGFPDPGLTSLFRIEPSGAFVTVTDQSSVVYGTIVLGADQMLYSSTAGSVHRMSIDGVHSVVYQHFPAALPVGPLGQLTELPDGSLAGISDAYPPIGRLLYGLDAAGEASILHVFEGFPSNVLLASDGHYYGGRVLLSSFLPILFRVEDNGSETTLHTFGDPGEFPSRLTEYGGQFWGTTPSGGTAGLGYLFKIDALGTYTPLHDFDSPEGGSPGELTPASDGNLYGNALFSDNFGTVFRAESDGNVAPIHDFLDDEGHQPYGRLEAASDGLLYGTTVSGGAFGHGTAFRMDLSGNLTTLYDFPVPHDANLTEGEPGAFYGTTATGSVEVGKVFRMDSDGAVTVVHDFLLDFLGFKSWYGPLLRASDGALYGTALRGGLYDKGGVYRILPNPGAPVLTSITPSSGSAAGGAAVVVQGLHLPPQLSLGAAAFGTLGPRHSLAFAVTPPLPAGTVQDLNAESFDGSTITLPEAFFADFLDVVNDNLFHDHVETLVRQGITAGCGGGNYCPTNPVRRDQMAVFLLKAEHGPSYTPSACTPPGAFLDVTCPGPFTDWVEQLAAEGITAGCGGGNYCPASPVNRQQMAVFLLKTLEGGNYTPPACTTATFTDVPCSSPFAPWIYELVARAITAGCGGGQYCPANTANRGQMATFMVKTFHLQ